MFSRLAAAGVLAVLLCAAAAGPAQAQLPTTDSGSSCPSYDPPAISVVLFDGAVYQSQTKKAFQLAREKAVKYGEKMPMEQGSIGSASLRVDTSVMVDTHQDDGCISVTKIDSKVRMDHKIEIASDFEPGTCMQGEIYNLEMELSQQDEEIVNDEIAKLRYAIREEMGKNYVYGPVRGVDLDSAVIAKRKEIEEMIAGHIKKLEQDIAQVRKETDLPEYFAEIKADCSGGVAPKK